MALVLSCLDVSERRHQGCSHDVSDIMTLDFFYCSLFGLYSSLMLMENSSSLSVKNTLLCFILSVVLWFSSLSDDVVTFLKIIG